MTDRQTLYGLPLESFVPERAALAKELRKQGQREQAAAIASLRKPSVSAWAVNQLVRTQAGDLKALFDAGDQLQRAQSELLAGRGDAPALREAVERERAAVGKLVDRARGLLSADGHELSQATLDRVADTLHAAALDEEARSQVDGGCLERELRHVGLGGGGELVAPAARPARRTKRDAGKGRPEKGGTGKGETAEADKADARREQRQRAERLKAARKAETDARRAADRADRRLQAAQARRDEAKSALEQAEHALEQAYEHAEQTGREHERAQRELDDL